MAKYLLQRFAYAVLVIVGVLFVVSVLVRIIPGDPVDVLMAGNPGITEAEKDALREQLGLKDPILVQFAKYVQGITRGDLGMSLRYRISSATLVLERPALRDHQLELEHADHHGEWRNAGLTERRCEQWRSV